LFIYLTEDYKKGEEKGNEISEDILNYSVGISFKSFFKILPLNFIKGSMDESRRNNNDRKRSRTALFSVDCLEGVEAFAKGLLKLGWRIIGTAETVTFLSTKGIAVTDVVDFVKIKESFPFPPTMHPKIEMALAAETEERIDLVYNIPYSHSKGNDVGGHTLLALAAKGQRITVFDPIDMQKVLEEMKNNAGEISKSFRRELVEKANAKIASHYLSLFQYQKKGNHDGLVGKRHYRLELGENPYQVPADLFSCQADEDPLALSHFAVKSKKNPCFVNLSDFDCLLNILCIVAQAFNKKYEKVPYLCIVAKHGNPCGLAFDWEDMEKTIEKALMGNPQSVWGGELICNFDLDQNHAQMMIRSEDRKKRFGNPFWMLHVIGAPAMDQKAYELLSKNSARKLLVNPALKTLILPSLKWSFRQVRGGFLRQPQPDYVLEFPEETEGENLPIEDLILAWGVAWGSNHGGNEIAVVKNGQLLGVGGGASTVEATKIACHRTVDYGHDPKGAAFAANAFFPFIDAPAILVEAGCQTGLFPSGGKNQKLVQDYFCKETVKIVLIAEEFRGFNRH
jgi:phosphoribosylaminoimidazolecarboxamide formyltransferase / IMP cyclohydrolase